MSAIAAFTSQVMGFLATLFIFFIGVILIVFVVLFFIDITQTRDVIRHNYPVVGRFRHLFSTLGEFFRRYINQPMVMTIP